MQIQPPSLQHGIHIQQLFTMGACMSLEGMMVCIEMTFMNFALKQRSEELLLIV